MKKAKHSDQHYGMDYTLLSKLDSERKAPPSTIPSSAFVRVFTGACVVCDFMILCTTTNKLMTESWRMVRCTALMMALLLDCPMAILGNVLAQWVAGLRKHLEGLLITIICLLAFGGMLYLYASLRISERDVLDSTATGLISLADSAAESGSSLPLARLMAFMPLITSLASLGIGLACSHPIKERHSMLLKQRATLQGELAKVNAALAECSDPEAEIRQAEATDEAKYLEFLHCIDVQASRLKQTARLLLMVRTGTPESITILTEKAQALCWQQPALLLPEAHASGAAEQLFH